MQLSRFARFSVAGSLCFVVGCAHEPFSHVQRMRYSISDREIQSLQFYLSGEVIVRVRSGSGDSVTEGQGVTAPQRVPVRQPVTERQPMPERQGVTEGQETIIAPQNTPGIATEVGSNWIRVTFRENGPGVPFAADEADSVSGRYYLATKDEEGRKMVRVRDIARRDFTIDGTNYELLYGSTVYLMVKPAAMQALIEKRTTLKGQYVP